MTIPLCDVKTPRVIMFDIAKKLEPKDIMNLCQTSKKFWKQIHENSEFWKRRAICVLRYNINELPENIGKQWYLDHCGTVYICGGICLLK